MTGFNIDLITEQPDRVFVEIDSRFNVVIERNERGLSIRVYPKTNGQLWDYPVDEFEVSEAEILELEAQF